MNGGNVTAPPPPLPGWAWLRLCPRYFWCRARQGSGQHPRCPLNPSSGRRPWLSLTHLLPQTLAAFSLPPNPVFSASLSRSSGRASLPLTQAREVQGGVRPVSGKQRQHEGALGVGRRRGSGDAGAELVRRETRGAPTPAPAALPRLPQEGRPGSGLRELRASWGPRGLALTEAGTVGEGPLERRVPP